MIAVLFFWQPRLVPDPTRGARKTSSTRNISTTVFTPTSAPLDRRLTHRPILVEVRGQFIEPSRFNLKVESTILQQVFCVYQTYAHTTCTHTHAHTSHAHTHTHTHTHRHTDTQTDTHTHRHTDTHTDTDTDTHTHTHTHTHTFPHHCDITHEQFGCLNHLIVHHPALGRTEPTPTSALPSTTTSDSMAAQGREGVKV